MKLHLPKKLLCAIFATTAVCASYSSSLYAQGEQAHVWSREDITAFISEMQSKTAPVFGTWDKVIEGNTGDINGVFQVPVGSILIKPDGTQEQLTETVYITKGGSICDAAGNVISEGLGYNALDDNLILKSDILSESGDVIYKSGDIILASDPSFLNASATNGTFFAGSNPTYQTATGSAITIDSTSIEKTVDSIDGTSRLEVVGGKLGASFGSSDAPVETKIFIQSAQDGTENFVYFNSAIGGNSAADEGMGAPGYNADFTGDSYIALRGHVDSTGKVTSYSYVETVVGGNMVDTQLDKENFYQANFNGNTHIALETGGDAGTVVGGNYIRTNGTESYKEGNATAQFNGSSYISGLNAYVTHVVGGNYGNSTSSHVGSVDNSITTSINLIASEFYSITGASFIDFAADTSFYGDTHINLIFSTFSDRNVSSYVPINAETGIKGGFNSFSRLNNVDTSISLQNTTATLVGDTNVTIDFYNETFRQGVEGSIVGGSFATHGLNVDHQGTANVTITQADDIEFSHFVVGGNVNGDADIYSHLSPSEIAYSSANQSHMSIEQVVVRVDSGLFNQSFGNGYNIDGLFTIGSMTQAGGSVHTGSTEAYITGGSINTLVGGNAATAQFVVNTPHSNAGAPGLDTTAGTTSIDSVQLHIDGATVYKVVGGSYINNAVTHIVGDNNKINTKAFSVGTVDVDIKSGTVGNIIGGSYVGQHIVLGTPQTEGGDAINYTATQGAIHVKLGGDTTVVGNMIAAAGVFAYSGSKSVVENYATNAQNLLTNNYFDALYSSSFDFNNIPLLTPFVGTGSEITVNSKLALSTESTNIELGNNVLFGNATTISGDYVTEDIATVDSIIGMPDMYLELITSLEEIKNRIDKDIANRGLTAEQGDLLKQWLSDFENQFNEDKTKLPTSDIVNHLSNVTGNRLLSLNEGTYSNLEKVSFVEFDEIAIGKNSVVDFSLSGQDLDHFAGRNVIDADGMHTAADDFSGTNTLRKTGTGTLKLSATNGQVNTEDNLQLVAEAGTVVLAANSAATTQTNFKTLIVQSAATLDMSAGSNTAGEAAGINGHLVLENMSTIIADAGRSVSEMGTSMIGGKLTVDAKFMLSLTNMDSVQLGEGATFTLDNGTSLNLGLFNIVLFSNLSYTDPTNVVGIDFLEGTWYGEDAKIAIASDYMKSNFYLGDGDAVMETGDTFIVWRANGDVLLTSGTAFAIPEPSTATLSLLALAGLMLRRRRKTA